MDTTELSRNTAASSGRKKLAVLLPVFPIGYLIYYIYSFAAPLPVNDQWDVAPFLISVRDGHPSLSLLFAFHNEHFIVIPRLCFATLAVLFTWDNRNECWCTFFLTLLIFFRLYRSVRYERKDALIDSLALMVVAIFLFGTNQWQNWLWGFQLAWPIPILCLVTAVPALYYSRAKLAPGITIVLATGVALLSMGSGFLVPAILLVILCLRYLRSRRRDVLPLLALCGFLVIGAVGFFYVLKPTSAGGISLGGKSLEGLAIILGNPFLDATTTLPQSLSTFTAAAIAVAAILVAMMAWLCVRGYQTGAFEGALYSTGFALAAWGLLSVSIIALARSRSGFEGLAQSRYISYAVLLPAGLLLMAVALAREPDLAPRDKWTYKSWIVFTSLLALLSLYREPVRLRWGQGMRETYRSLFEFVKIAPAFRNDDELHEICPRDDRGALFDGIASRRLIKGMVPPGREVSPLMLKADKRMGKIDSIFTGADGIDVIGWCAPDGERVPDAAFLGTRNEDGSMQLLAPIVERTFAGDKRSKWRVHVSPGSTAQSMTLVTYDWRSNRFYYTPGNDLSR